MNQIDEFSKKYKVVCIDLAGHGHSSQQREVYSMESFAKDVKTVIDKIGSQRVILIGHSMGGAVTLLAAQQMPERVIGVIGADTMHDFEDRLDEAERKQFIDPIVNDFSKNTPPFVRGMFREGTDTVLVDAIVRDMAAAPEKVAISALQELFKVEEDTIVKGLAIPIVCINADFWSTNYETNKRLNPDFRLYIVKNAGHFHMLEYPKKFNQKLDRAIDYIVKKRNSDENN
jgi:pimeloyl-ACP methyl ester carboxylesterase